MYEHCSNIGRTVHVVNLDPAAEEFHYPVSVDIRTLINLTDVMEMVSLGPNGGLVYCMEYLVDNIAWLEEQIGEFDDDYLIFDCPGQVELYMHIPVIPELLSRLQAWGYSIAGVYVVDSQFVSDGTKFLSGALMCLSAMLQLQLPHVNVLSKMDLLKARGEADALDAFLEADTTELLARVSASADSRFSALNGAVAELLESYQLVSFLPLDITDDDSVGLVLAHIDHAIQWGEDEEFKEPRRGDDDADDGEAAEDEVLLRAANLGFAGRGYEHAEEGGWGVETGDAARAMGGAADDMEGMD
eukprot:c9220_g1_i2.p1 GENE.c9220_g1_i2~~c9220_g1_i2.p1  ORF type:complete len:341 (+),score=66.52 c9220_g1_i2:121-1023(+)